MTRPYAGRIFTPRMIRKASYASLSEYFEAGVETQEQLADRCAAEGQSVSQAHLSRVAAGDNCSLNLAKVLARLTGVPLESFGERDKGAA